MARPIGATEQRTETWKDRLDKQRLRNDNTRDIQINPNDMSRDANEVRSLDNGPDQIGFAKGGKVKKTGSAKVHKGEQVVKKSSAQKYGSAKMAAVNKGTARVSTARGKR